MREKQLFDFNWKFYMGDLQPNTNVDGEAGFKSCTFGFGATDKNFDDSKWKSINLPHDFVLEGNYTRTNQKFREDNGIPDMETIDNHLVSNGSLPGGIGWYRKTFSVPREDDGKRFYLLFDGIFRESTVYFNHFFVGNHSSGYTSFYYDITDFINYGGENLVAVRVDATGHEGWWYEGGGIYRHVWLVKTDPLHVAPWGTYINSTFQRYEDKITAEIEVATDIINKYSGKVKCQLVSQILDAENEIIANTELDINILEWDHSEIRQFMNFNNPRIWSLETPYLYKLISKVYMEGRETDSYETTFGVRKIHFDPENGFLLNDMPVKIKGMCCHQSHAGVGIALTDRINEFRLEKMKEMGCNAYRSAHHTATPELLDICDRLGILVMEENRILSSCNENIEQLRSMIIRDRNHPSIILWSIGNEEAIVQQRVEGMRIAHSLKMIAHKYDPTRPVTLAIVFWDFNNNKLIKEIDTFLPLSKELDIMGFNYGFDNIWEEYHSTLPKQPIIITEASSGYRTRGCYSTNKDTCSLYPMDESYGNKAENQWKKVAENSYISGTFVWTGFDYRGEPTPYSWPAVGSQFGILDQCGFPKDNYYYFKSWWSNEPVLHLFPHWNWPDKVGESIDIFCYSNCDEVELFVNNKSYGKKAMQPNWYLHWDNVVYEPGVLMAKGWKDDALVCECKVETVDSPYQVVLSADRDVINADGVDVSMVTVKITDQKGRLVPYADNQVFFNIEGSGRILGVGNGNPCSHESDKANMRRAFNGLCQVIIQADSNPGEIILSAVSDGLYGGKLNIMLS